MPNAICDQKFNFAILDRARLESAWLNRDEKK